MNLRRCLLVFVPILAFAGVAWAESDAPGVTDFSGATAEAIQVEDITGALAVPRGTVIEASAPPTLRLPIFFELNSTQLRPEARGLLDKVSVALATDELGEFRFSVEGHTDALGSEHYNSNLSAARANVVETYLIERGVPKERLGTIGHGESSPVSSNDTDEGRQRNRRVELINLGTTQ